MKVSLRFAVTICSFCQFVRIENIENTRSTEAVLAGQRHFYEQWCAVFHSISHFTFRAEFHTSLFTNIYQCDITLLYNSVVHCWCGAILSNTREGTLKTCGSPTYLGQTKMKCWFTPHRTFHDTLTKSIFQKCSVMRSSYQPSAATDQLAARRAAEIIFNLLCYSVTKLPVSTRKSWTSVNTSFSLFILIYE